MQSLALFFLVAVAIGGVAWVFIYPMLSGERQAERRKETVTKTGSVALARAARNPQKSRREQVEGTLKDIEIRQAKKSVPLHMKITQAGLTWSKRQYIIISARPGRGGVLPVHPDRRRPVGGARHGVRGRLRHAALAAQISEEAARGEVPRGVSGRGGYHRPRHQVRPAAARQHADHRHRRVGAGARRIPRDHRNAGHRHADRRGLRRSSSSGFRSPRPISSAS